jgi:hypothetical protein
LEVSGRRMPPALFLGITTFSTSTRLNDGSRRLIAAIAADLLFFFLGNKQTARLLHSSQGLAALASTVGGVYGFKVEMRRRARRK